MMRSCTRKWALWALLMVAAPGAQADIMVAEQLIREVQNTLLTRVRQGGAALQEDPARLRALVREIVVPHVDTRTMCKLVLGRHWKQADTRQQAEFVEQFSTLLIRTYARSLLNQNQYEVNFLPSVPGSREGSAMVRTELVSAASGKNVKIFFRMREGAEGWQVIDIVVEGISLIITYREDFRTQVQAEGLPRLIEKLRSGNTRARAGSE